MRRVCAKIVGGTVLAMVLATLLAACATSTPNIAERINALLPADVILLGEQHDAPDHQRIHRDVITHLAERGALAAVAIEMADQGSSTATLNANASEDQVRTALNWRQQAWNWSAYGPAIMTAVRAGVPVLGANLPRPAMGEAMRNPRFDMLLSGPALKAQQQLIRSGHCDLLPESQIQPMTRVQLARDVAMAQTLASAVVPGKTVLLLAGSGHADRALGVPQHLPQSLKSKSVLLLADRAQPATEKVASFDTVWATLPAPVKDYCAEFKAQRASQSGRSTPTPDPAPSAAQNQ